MMGGSLNIYLIGSLRNPKVTEVANRLRDEGFEVFDDWMAAGPEADDYWQDYEKERGHTFAQALQGLAARHVYEFDRYHLTRADVGILMLPAGKSGHLELGWILGRGKTGFILLDGEPDRFDVMYLFADGVFTALDELIVKLKEWAPRRPSVVPSVEFPLMAGGRER